MASLYQEDLEALEVADGHHFYVLEWLSAAEVDGRRECIAMVVMKRAGGLLLAIPEGFLPEDVVAEGGEDENAVVGHSTVITAAGVLLEQGVLTPIGRQVSALVVDVDSSMVSLLRKMEEEESIMFPFAEEDPFAFPAPEELQTKVLTWLEGAEELEPLKGPNWYTPVQTEESAGEALSQRRIFRPKPKPAPQGGGSPTVPQREKQKKPTTASLAASLQEVLEVLPSITEQLQVMSQRQQSMEERMSKQSSISASLSQPLGGTGVVSNTAALAKDLPKPPRVKAGPPALLPVAMEPTELKELQEIRGEGVGGDVAKAMLAQSAALTSLVAQLTSSSQDPMQELQSGFGSGVRGAQGRARLQGELASQKGLFFHAVLMQMARRMAPTMVADQPYGTLMSNGVSGVKYLERFGGYGRQREIGMIMYQVMVAFDFMMVENYEAAKDCIALLAVMLEQACLDQGRFDLAQLLTLQEDVPASIFTNRQVSSLSRSRAFAPLADQRWVTCSLAFLKELETISSKRTELTSTSQGSGGGDASLTQRQGGLGGVGSPKKKGRGAGRGKAQEGEEEQQ